jgi:hypothetical protein
MKKIAIQLFFIFLTLTLFSQPGDQDNILPVVSKSYNKIEFYHNNSPVYLKIKYDTINTLLKNDLILKFNSSLSINEIYDKVFNWNKDTTGIYDYSGEKNVNLVLFISRYPDQMIPIPFQIPIDPSDNKPFTFEIPFSSNQNNETYSEMPQVFKRLLKNPKSQLISFNFFINILPKDSSSSYGLPLASTSLLVYNEEPSHIKLKKVRRHEIIEPHFFGRFFKREKKNKEIKEDTVYVVPNMKIYKKMEQQLPHYQLQLYPREDVRYQYLNQPIMDPAVYDSIHKNDKLYYGAGYQLIKKTKAGKKFTKGYVYVAISKLPKYEGCLFYFDAVTCKFLFATRLIAVPS